ncbi:MAG TPA: ATP-binding protein [Casimicrobiaceae bacterium]
MESHREVEARIENLGELLALIDAVCRERGVSREIAFQTRLAVDEMCTNVIVHGYRGLQPGPIALTVTPHPDRLVIRIVDRGYPFDPRSAPAPDLCASVEERPIGGLGCHLVRSVMDGIDYETTVDGGNRLTLVKLTDGTS